MNIKTKEHESKPDNLRVERPEIHKTFTRKPKPLPVIGQDNRSKYEKVQSDNIRNSKDNNQSLYESQHIWNINPTRQVTKNNALSEFQNSKDAIKATTSVGLGTAAITAPLATAGGIAGDVLTNKVVKGVSGKESWGELLADKTGVGNKEAWEFTNPGAILGGIYGAKKQSLVSDNNLISKFIKGDEDLAWNSLNRHHWALDKASANPTNIGLAVMNRIAPFLNTTEKIPGKIAAYNIAKRTRGNASVSIPEIMENSPTYTGASSGLRDAGKNLLGYYLFNDTPIINKTPWFKNIASKFRPAYKDNNNFSFGERYEKLYPGVDSRRFQMTSVIANNHPLRISPTSSYLDDIGKIKGKETGMLMRDPMGNWIKFREPGENWIHPIDDIAGHLTKLDFHKGRLKQTSQDLWKFNPKDYKARWDDKPSSSESVRLLKQAALMDKVGRPFILQQTNPIYSNGRPVKAMKSGGRFTFKKSRLLKNDEDLNKRDMRKKVVKSNRPTYSVKRIRKGQDGLRFASYNSIENNNYDMPTANPFSEYSFPELTITKPVQPKETPTQPTVQPVIQPEIQPIEETPIATQWSNNYTGKRGKWVADLTSAYRKAGISNNNALKMLIAQDALESGWGKSAQGDYNFGNITPGKSWKGRIVTGKDKNAKGEIITQKFRAYDSLEDYAKDKVQFLKRLYDFSDTDDIQTFASKLQGGNKDKRKYAESADYLNGLLKVYKGMA